MLVRMECNCGVMEFIEFIESIVGDLTIRGDGSMGDILLGGEFMAEYGSD